VTAVAAVAGCDSGEGGAMPGNVQRLKLQRVLGKVFQRLAAVVASGRWSTTYAAAMVPAALVEWQGCGARDRRGLLRS
jgi:hypothetical protein